MSVRFRIAAAAALILVVIAVRVTLVHGYNGYTARVLLTDAGGLENGSNVNVNGATVGTVANLTVNKKGLAVAMLHLNKQAAPLGETAHATVEIDGFFGERLVNLTRGDYRTQPQRSGFTIPVSQSGESVRLDDVLDSLNMDAQGALRTFLDEQGTALVGRGQDLEAVLAELPQTLPQLTTLMNQFSSNQQALADLVTRSDQVVSEVAGQRHYLGSMVNSANSALSALASRRDQLGATVQDAPGALKQAQTSLAAVAGHRDAAGAGGRWPAHHRAEPADGAAPDPGVCQGRRADAQRGLGRVAVTGPPGGRRRSDRLEAGAADQRADELQLAGPGTAGDDARRQGRGREPLRRDGGMGAFDPGLRRRQPCLPVRRDRQRRQLRAAALGVERPGVAGAAPPARHHERRRRRRRLRRPRPTATVTKTVHNVTSGVGSVLSGVGSVVSHTLGAVTGTVSGVASKVTGALHLGGGSTGSTTSTTSSAAGAQSLLNYLLGK